MKTLDDLKVGDDVQSIKQGVGVVTEVYDDGMYPILVKFHAEPDNIYTYTRKGTLYVLDSVQELYPFRFKIVPLVYQYHVAYCSEGAVGLTTSLYSSLDEFYESVSVGNMTTEWAELVQASKREV